MGFLKSASSLLLVLILSLCLPATALAAEDISIGLDRIQYSDDAGRTVDYDFTSGSLLGGNIILPGTAYSTPYEDENPYLFKGKSELSGYEKTDGTLWFSTPQVPDAEEIMYLASFYILPEGGTRTEPADNPAQWTVSVKDFKHATLPQHTYNVLISFTNSTYSSYPPDYTQEIYTAHAIIKFFTGISSSTGNIYDCLVYGRVYIKRPATNQYWVSRNVYLGLGLDPAAMTLDLRLNVDSRDSISGSCSLNGGRWRSLGQVQVDGADIRPMAVLVPSVSIFSTYSSPWKTIQIQEYDTEVQDFYYLDKLFSTWITECAISAGSHQDFVDCVSQAASCAKDVELISGIERDSIINCAARADIPPID